MNENERQLLWEKEIISAGYSQSMPFGWFEDHAIGGDMGSRDEDFEVSEIPAYLPTGEGEHIYLWIRKAGRSTLDVQKLLCSVFGVPEADVGYAGKKDVHAITRQWFSVRSHKLPEDAIDRLNAAPGVHVETVTRHANKLRMGHLKGNRFGVSLYGVQAPDDAIALCCERLKTHGFINYFGLQRFGHNGDNIAQGLGMMDGLKVRVQQGKMYISALQSAIFNLYAARRFVDVGFAPRIGDVIQKIGKGCFVCDDPDTDTDRAKNGEIAVTGCLPGCKVMMGSGYTADLESRCARDFGIAWPDPLEGLRSFDKVKKFAEGDRRMLWVRPQSVTFKRLADPGAVRLEFDLPSGCFATVLLRHICGPGFTR